MTVCSKAAYFDGEYLAHLSFCFGIPNIRPYFSFDSVIYNVGTLYCRYSSIWALELIETNVNLIFKYLILIMQIVCEQACQFSMLNSGTIALVVSLVWPIWRPVFCVEVQESQQHSQKLFRRFISYISLHFLLHHCYLSTIKVGSLFGQMLIFLKLYIHYIRQVQIVPLSNQPRSDICLSFSNLAV